MNKSNSFVIVGYILIAAMLCLVSYQQGVINTMKRCNATVHVYLSGAPK